MNGRRVSTIVYFSLVAFNKQSKSFQSFRNVFFWGELQQTENQPTALHKPIKTSGEEEIRNLARGDYFGEQALLKTDFRTANVVASSTTVECLVLDRE